MQCIYNGSSLARFVPEILPFEEEKKGLVYSESWILLTDHFGPVFIVEHFSCARAVFISAMFSVQLQIFVRSVFIKLGVGGCASRWPHPAVNWPQLALQNVDRITHGSFLKIHYGGIW